MALKLYNTASRSLEVFTPPPRLPEDTRGQAPYTVTMYNCGPTVYNYVHIGNLRAYVFADILRRALEREGYVVKQIVNITDVGHLVADSDDGEDKMEIAIRREHRGVEEIIAEYSDAFFTDMKSLNVHMAQKFPRATAYIEEQRKMIEVLARNGYTYVTSDGIYFDTEKFPAYPDFAKLDVAGMQAGNRVDMGEKKNSTDFAVWKFSPEDLPASAGTGEAGERAGGKHREQEWDSPLGELRKGFPGWHIECSAIIKAELGDTIDIHTGGIDHIPIHHTNEIAQSQSANGVPLARFWMHGAFMNIGGEKISKSLGNTFRLIDLRERGVPPLAFRYWLLTAHYRTQVNFTWEALAGAQSAYNKMTSAVYELPRATDAAPIQEYLDEFTLAIEDDLNTASVIALVWKLLKDGRYAPGEKYNTIRIIDKVLGLELGDIPAPRAFEIPPEVITLLAARKKAREENDWALSDALRAEIKLLGYDVKDTGTGQTVTVSIN